ncbi:PhzF family phenazine biosynthesis protein [Rhodobacteraceae bacterium CCMM004]|nr:PhzF family phenazine biosynthesis protein [Rhodobacteraceae bacterium CCMM004]
MTAYLVYDVFAETRFGGNPLAVVLDAQELDEATLLPIAQEFGFSETTFVYPPEVEGHTARVRIFTPARELPFAGHPTVGTAVALADLGHPTEQVLELGVGPIPATVTGDRAAFATGVPLETLGAPDPAAIAACLGLEPGALRQDRHAPVIASVGLPFVLAEVADAAALGRCTPALGPFAEASALAGLDTHFALYAYTRDGAEVRARMFSPLDGIHEDPATGSAAAALTAYLADLDDGPLSLTIAQGVEMGRPSRIEAQAQDGTVRIGGRALRVMEGRLHLA